LAEADAFRHQLVTPRLKILTLPRKAKKVIDAALAYLVTPSPNNLCPSLRYSPVVQYTSTPLANIARLKTSKTHLPIMSPTILTQQPIPLSPLPQHIELEDINLDNYTIQESAGSEIPNQDQALDEHFADNENANLMGPYPRPDGGKEAWLFLAYVTMPGTVASRETSFS
jgi:hypothetical protein